MIFARPAFLRFHAQMRVEMKKSRAVRKSYYKVVSKITNAKFMQGTARGKSRIE